MQHGNVVLGQRHFFVFHQLHGPVFNLLCCIVAFKLPAVFGLFLFFCLQQTAGPLPGLQHQPFGLHQFFVFGIDGLAQFLNFDFLTDRQSIQGVFFDFFTGPFFARRLPHFRGQIPLLRAVFGHGAKIRFGVVARLHCCTVNIRGCHG